LERILNRSLAPAEFVDHINGNSLDNRRINLRLCNRSQNAFNSKAHRDNASGYKGVVLRKKDMRWVAEFNHSHLGSFDTPEAAHAAYLAAAQQYAGEFARSK